MEEREQLYLDYLLQGTAGEHPNVKRDSISFLEPFLESLETCQDSTWLKLADARKLYGLGEVDQVYDLLKPLYLDIDPYTSAQKVDISILFLSAARHLDDDKEVLLQKTFEYGQIENNDFFGVAFSCVNLIFHSEYLYKLGIEDISRVYLVAVLSKLEFSISRSPILESLCMQSLTSQLVARDFPSLESVIRRNISLASQHVDLAGDLVHSYSNLSFAFDESERDSIYTYLDKAILIAEEPIHKSYALNCKSMRMYELKESEIMSIDSLLDRSFFEYAANSCSALKVYTTYALFQSKPSQINYERLRMEMERECYSKLIIAEMQLSIARYWFDRKEVDSVHLYLSKYHNLVEKQYFRSKDIHYSDALKWAVDLEIGNYLSFKGIWSENDMWSVLNLVKKGRGLLLSKCRRQKSLDCYKKVKIRKEISDLRENISIGLYGDIDTILLSQNVNLFKGMLWDYSKVLIESMSGKTREDYGAPMNRKLSSCELVVRFYSIGDQYLLFYETDKKIDIKVLESSVFDTLISKVNMQLRDPMSGIIETNKSLQDIYNHIFRGISFSNIDFLYIVPDGDLVEFPFGALMGDDGVYLVEKYDIVYVFQEVVNIRPFVSFNKNVLAISYSGKEDLQELTPRRLPELASSITETSLVDSLFDKCFLIQGGVSENFDELFKEFDIIHLATHAYSDRIVDGNNGLFFKGVGGVLKKWRSASLNPQELDAQLVVISSCESAIGKRSLSEGMLSLSYDFLLAGADNVISTLWRVNDEVSASLMKDFYLSVTSGKSIAMSLSDAQRRHLKKHSKSKYSHPYFWAAYKYESI